MGGASWARPWLENNFPVLLHDDFSEELDSLKHSDLYTVASSRQALFQTRPIVKDAKGHFPYKNHRHKNWKQNLLK